MEKAGKAYIQPLNVMSYSNNITCVRTALTLAETIIAMAIMAIVFAVVLPQFEAIRNSWNSKAGAAETLQNGRILTEHMYRNLSTAVKITSVSNASETNGYIEFENNDGDILRYDVNSTYDYVEFGMNGSLSDFAGPVSQLLFTCYDINDFDTPITDGNSIRFVRAEIIFPNSNPSGRDKTFIVSAYLRTNWNSGSSTSGLVGWWKLDESSGLTAVDSSGNGNNGTLVNMVGDEWINGIMDGALELDGINDYVDTDYKTDLPVWTICVWVTSPAAPAAGTAETQAGPIDRETNYKIIWDYGIPAWQGSAGVRVGHFWYIASFGTLEADKWYHLAATYDGETLSAYKDGVLITSNTDPSGEPDSETSTLKFGRSAILEKYFTGTIDDARVYNRVLGLTEIAQLAGILRYRDFTEAKISSDTTSITISTPDTNEGDLLIAAVATDGDTSASIAPPEGEGWTAIYTGDYNNEVTLGAWWKLADVSESSSHQFTWTGDEQAYAWMMRFTGHKASNPINDHSASGETSSTPTSPEVTTTLDNCLILRLGAFDDDDITVDEPGLSGHTAITMDKTNAAGETGLKGDYYDNTDFTNLVLTRTDPTVDFDWGSSAPDPSIGEDTFSVRWTGYVKPLYSETYTFKTFSDDGDRVWVDNQLLIDDWAIQHGPKTNEGTIALTAGQLYEIKVEFYDNTNNAKINLYWSSLSQSEEIIPESQLYAAVGGGGDPISGGAGYVKQPTSGDSGTSNFSLGSSNETKTLTIAIAPENEGGGSGGGGDINP